MATTVPSYRKLPQPRATFLSAARSIAEDTLNLINTSRRAVDRIVNDHTTREATFATVLLPVTYCRNAIASEARVLCFYKDVSPDPALRQESHKSQILLDHFDTEIAMREDLFDLVDAVVKRNEDLDSESQRLLEFEHRNFLTNGLGIAVGPLRDRSKQIKQRLSEVVNEFRRNMVEERGGMACSRKELEGVPAAMLQRLQSCDISDEHMNKLHVTFQMVDSLPLLRHTKSGYTRASYFTAYENRCMANVPLFKDMVLLRDEAARMLGHDNHAELRTEELMAKTPMNVQAFLDDLQSQLQPVAQAELHVLRELKKQHLQDRGIDFDGKFYVWDFSFYHNLMLETHFSVDQEAIAEFFPVQIVVPKMLEIFETLFGLCFQQCDRDDGRPSDASLTWHNDVVLYDVWDSEDRGGAFLGFMYLDLYAREGKYGNGYVKQDGTRHYPSTALVCNFNKPQPSEPSLLRHSDVCLLFHELGHGIHDLVAKTTYSQFHGTATVDDFCEAPSQMLERWCWSAAPLKQLSQHYSTLTPEYLTHWRTKHNDSTDEKPPSRGIPTSMIESLLKSEKVNAALVNLRSLFRAAFDLKVHMPPDRVSLENMDFTHEWNTLQTQVVGLDAPKDTHWGHGYAQFSHQAEGYDASFYGYLYSRVYASDMFATAFEANPMNHEVGRQYRECILEAGGSRDPMELLFEFLERKPDTSAFACELGLSR